MSRKVSDSFVHTREHVSKKDLADQVLQGSNPSHQAFDVLSNSFPDIHKHARILGKSIKLKKNLFRTNVLSSDVDKAFVMNKKMNYITNNYPCLIYCQKCFKTT